MNYATEHQEQDNRTARARHQNSKSTATEQQEHSNTTTRDGNRTEVVRK